MYNFNDEQKKIIRARLLRNSNIIRLLGNRNWEGAANAAMDFFVDGKDCTIGWKETSTWKQVKYAIDDIIEKEGVQNDIL